MNFIQITRADCACVFEMHDTYSLSMHNTSSSFIDIYQGKFKHIVQLDSFQTPLVQSSFKPMQDTSMAGLIMQAIDAIGDTRHYQAKERA